MDGRGRRQVATGGVGGTYNFDAVEPDWQPLPRALTETSPSIRSLRHRLRGGKTLRYRSVVRKTVWAVALDDQRERDGARLRGRGA